MHVLDQHCADRHGWSYYYSNMALPTEKVANALSVLIVLPLLIQLINTQPLRDNTRREDCT